MDFGDKPWARSREAVDTVLELLLKELRVEGSHYDGLRIDSYIRQGSSRDGLKVVAPDEFDTILEFHIEGLEAKMMQKNIYKQREGIVPGYCFMVIEDKTMDWLEQRFPQMHRKGVFVTKDGAIHVSSRNLHQRLFESIFDKALNTVIDKVKAYGTRNPINFSIGRRMNPPAINIIIKLSDETHEVFMRSGQPRNIANLTKEIDVDIVPGLLLRYDRETSHSGVTLNCPIHAVCKWAEEERTKSLADFVDTSLVWDVKTTGYEKHLMDVARQKQRKLYILTALRIVKTYFVKTKKIAREGGNAPPPIVTVMKSYHLKQIAIYLIYYLCHVHPYFRLDGAKRATLYFLDMMKIALDKRRLPHFFYSNNNVQVMLPGFPAQPTGSLRYDLFRGIPQEALNQARLSLDNHLIPNLGFSLGGGDGDSERDTVNSQFNSTTEGMDFF